MSTIDIINHLPLPDMVKYTKQIAFFIVLTGIALPFLSSTIAINLTSVHELVATILYFVFVSFCVWTGVVWLINRLRKKFTLSNHPFAKIFALCLTTFLYTLCVIMLLTYGWLVVNTGKINTGMPLRTALMGGIIVVVLTLVYEVFLLTRERVLDNKIVGQLDLERSQAEMTARKNELDPHFIFNSLTTLSHLIHADADKAYLFNNKLAQVYKYILLNKDRELISIDSEMEFINDYFFLLRIRHDDKLQLKIDLDNGQQPKGMILPCSLQILVENAIKHNEFSEQHPLQIQITGNQRYIEVINNIRPKPYSVDSTRIGLKNLSYRYKLTANKDITVEKLHQHFIVKLPVIKTENP